MRPLLVTIAVACLLVGCGITGYEPAPVLPPPTPWEPVEPPPVEDPVAPPASAFDQIAEGMTRAHVESIVGTPTEDQPEAPSEESDTVRYDVVTEDGPASWFVIYSGGVVLRARFVQTVVVR